MPLCNQHYDCKACRAGLEVELDAGEGIVKAALQLRTDHAAAQAAIAAALEWFHDPDADAIDEYERIGAMYHRDTGFLRPGKSEPLVTGRDSNSDENRTRWALWCAEQSRRVLGMLRDAAKAGGA